VEVQAFRFGSAYGVQFHFEVTEDIIAGWCDQTGAETLADVWGTTKEQLLAEAQVHLATQQAAARTLVERFLRR
jgi:GMP synthase-like glutamine amidotransferase